MGRNKNRHSKDKLYLTVTEHKQQGGRSQKPPQSQYNRNPFNCCSLSQAPFIKPYCTPDGTVFDLLSIVPILKSTQTNPLTGDRLQMKDLIKLTYHKNSQGEFHCPILYRVFTDNSHIVTLKTTGNVFSKEAIQQLCIKPNNWVEPLTGTPIVPSDLITLHTPQKSAIKKPKKEQRHFKQIFQEKEVIQPKHQVHSTGMTAASFTSTSLDPQPKNTYRPFNTTQIREKAYLYIKQHNLQGSASFLTSHGRLTCKLYCSKAPMACENFLQLCQQKYFDNSIFHRSIPKFMIQGGDPSGTGTGGRNIFGIPHFQDEFDTSLSFSCRGMLGMANSGPNTNKSQFFITYGAVPHLNNKHTLFGELSEGFETLLLLESLQTDSQNRITKTTVKILQTQVHSNPFQQAKSKAFQKTQQNENWLQILKAPPSKRIGIGRFLPEKPKSLPSGLFAEFPSKKAKISRFNFDQW